MTKQETEANFEGSGKTEESTNGRCEGSNGSQETCRSDELRHKQRRKQYTPLPKREEDESANVDNDDNDDIDEDESAWEQGETEKDPPALEDCQAGERSEAKRGQESPSQFDLSCTDCCISPKRSFFTFLHSSDQHRNSRALERAVDEEKCARLVRELSQRTMEACRSALDRIYVDSVNSCEKSCPVARGDCVAEPNRRKRRQLLTDEASRHIDDAISSLQPKLLRLIRASFLAEDDKKEEEEEEEVVMVEKHECEDSNRATKTRHRPLESMDTADVSNKPLDLVLTAAKDCVADACPPVDMALPHAAGRPFVQNVTTTTSSSSSSSPSPPRPYCEEPMPPLAYTSRGNGDREVSNLLEIFYSGLTNPTSTQPMPRGEVAGGSVNVNQLTEYYQAVATAAIFGLNPASLQALQPPRLTVPMPLADPATEGATAFPFFAANRPAGLGLPSSRLMGLWSNASSGNTETKTLDASEEIGKSGRMNNGEIGELTGLFETRSEAKESDCMNVQNARIGQVEMLENLADEANKSRTKEEMSNNIFAVVWKVKKNARWEAKMLQQFGHFGRKIEYSRCLLMPPKLRYILGKKIRVGCTFL
ncbi:unnamed protein product [Protopolystoma xenopodis]|uniref:Uncharacterized protein n=1 Tax=Protopolystoma xenopodis TaxID=117903 RepID=A0A3S5CRC7_9PLAT|nr:unnamed protein product [Protopolystoma xenopodis]